MTVPALVPSVRLGKAHQEKLLEHERNGETRAEADRGGRNDAADDLTLGEALRVLQNRNGGRNKDGRREPERQSMTDESNAERKTKAEHDQQAPSLHSGHRHRARDVSVQCALPPRAQQQERAEEDERDSQQSGQKA